MKRSVTIIDVAREAGISKSTVSRVLSGDAYGVSSSAKAKVVAAVAKLGYVQNTVASSMRTNRTRTVLLIVPDIANAFWAEVARGVQDRLDDETYSLVVASSDWESERERRYLQLARRNRVDAILMNAPEISSAELADIHCPVVLMGDQKNSAAYPVVGSDTYTAVLDALEYLYSIGHRDIGLVHHEMPDSEGHIGSRFRAYTDFFDTKSLKRNDRFLCQAHLTVEGGMSAARAIAAMHNPPSALLCGNDLVAIGFLQAARALGIDVPGDISVVGIDDIPAATLVSPALTTIQKPAGTIGSVAAELVLRLLHDGSVSGEHRLSAKLVLRETTKPIRQPQDEQL